MTKNNREKLFVGLILIITMLIGLRFVLYASADEPKAVNIRVTDYPEKTVTISHEFEITDTIPQSDYYKCLDVCFCDGENEDCEDVCKTWCYNNYVK